MFVEVSKTLTLPNTSVIRQTCLANSVNYFPHISGQIFLILLSCYSLSKQRLIKLAMTERKRLGKNVFLLFVCRCFILKGKISGPANGRV